MIDDLDWRLDGVESIEKLANDKFQMNSSGEYTLEIVDPVKLQDGRILALPIPNATAMMLNASNRAYHDAQKLLDENLIRIIPRDIVKMKSSADAVDVVEYLILSVFSAYTSLECFANEWIPPWITYRKKERGGTEKILGKEEIERQISLKTKIDTILPWVFKVESPKGNSFWESFVKLENARNRIVHMKHVDRESSDLGTDTIWKILFMLPPPYLTAKNLVDWFMENSPHVPGLAYDKLRPVKPRWIVKYQAKK